MGGELVLVAVGVDATKEISTDYALEWAMQNVTKAEDFFILLAVLPSSQRPTPNLNRRRQSLASYFLWCRLFFTILYAFIFIFFFVLFFQLLTM